MNKMRIFYIVSEKYTRSIHLRENLVTLIINMDICKFIYRKSVRSSFYTKEAVTATRREN